MRDLSKAIQTDLTKMLRQYEELLEAAEDAEQIASAKLSEAQRHKRYWQVRISQIKDELQSQSAA